MKSWAFNLAGSVCILCLLYDWLIHVAGLDYERWHRVLSCINGPGEISEESADAVKTAGRLALMGRAKSAEAVCSAVLHQRVARKQPRLFVGWDREGGGGKCLASASQEETAGTVCMARF